MYDNKKCQYLVFILFLYISCVHKWKLSKNRTRLTDDYKENSLWIVSSWVQLNSELLSRGHFLKFSWNEKLHRKPDKTHEKKGKITAQRFSVNLILFIFIVIKK